MSGRSSSGPLSKEAPFVVRSPETGVGRGFSLSSGGRGFRSSFFGWGGGSSWKGGLSGGATLSVFFLLWRIPLSPDV